ncbi:MAG: ABC transporter ATP-binding protein [Chlorobi bacterium]|nr:ABC transporter ATP-binding protein [Chlorobiota bacterium]
MSVDRQNSVAGSDPVVQVRNLTKRFGHFTAVNNLSFEIAKGEIFGLLGANGAGKTTLIKMLCGLSRPTAGMANVAGYNLITQPEMIKRRIGYMSQKFSLYEDLTVQENIRFFGGIYGLSKREAIDAGNIMIGRLGLEKMKNRLIGSLPLGWKQKIAFSVAILHHPGLIFLDEPTSGVDPVTRRQFWEMILETAGRGYTIIVTTHYMDEAEYCNRVAVMVEGNIAALDSPENLQRHYHVANMEDLFWKLTREINGSVTKSIQP